VPVVIGYLLGGLAIPSPPWSGALARFICELVAIKWQYETLSAASNWPYLLDSRVVC